MGFCTKCGAENVDGAKFCKSCGAPLQAAGNEAANASQPQMNGNVYATTGAQQNKTGNFSESLKKISWKVWAGLAAAVVAIIVIAVVAINIGSTVNLNKFLTIETSGYDGYGRVKASIDWDAVAQQYNSKMSYTSQARKEYGGLLKLTTPTEVLRDYVNVNIDATDHLTNGDEISYTIEIDDELYEYLKCKVKAKDGSYTIEDLTPVEKFDAFGDLSVTFEGVSPEGYLDMEYYGSELDVYDFYCENRSGLSNGDTVKITIDESTIENCAERLGKVPSISEAEFQVSGLSYYVTELGQIPSNAIDAMKSQAEDVYNAHVARSWGDGEKLLNFEYLGEYLLTPKNGGGNNNLYLIYKARVHNTDTDSKGKVEFDKMTDVYWYIRYRNLMIDGEGDLVFDVNSYDTVGNTFYVHSKENSWWGRSWYYYGYETLDELYKNVVTSNMDSYNHEENINEEVTAADTTVEQAEPENLGTDADYILPDSDKRLLTEEDLEGLSADECKLARNEIYARHGRKFKDEEIQSYFDSKDWYEGTVEAADFKEDYLPEIERKNVQFISDYEEEKGYK